MRFPLNVLALLAIFPMLWGCATDRPFGEAKNVQVTDLDTLPVPSESLSYRIGPQQKLNVLVVGAEDLSGVFLTDDLGNMTYPLVGEVAIGGRLPSEASRMLEDSLRGRYLLNPQVRIVPDEIPERSISVGGQVNRPGAYPALGDLTLLRAVNLAEGVSDFAKLDDVIVLRTVDGRDYIGVYNIRAIERGNYPDPVVYPNDVVMVGDSTARRRLASILQFVPLVTSALVLVERFAR